MMFSLPLPDHLVAAAVSVLLLTAVTLPVASSHAAQEYRLSTDVVPTFESVRLFMDPDRTDYTGTVKIELDVRTAVSSFSFHAEAMKLERVVLKGNDEEIALMHQEGEKGKITATTPQPIAPGTYTLEIDFSNDFGTRAVGLYRMEQDGQGYVFTQFEADDGREAFPMWDEPNFKIPWQLTFVIPNQYEAVTNTPIESETTDGKTKTLVFQRTRPMPSYLLAIAVGPLEFVPIPGMSIPGNVVTVRGQEHLAGLAVDMTPPILAGLEKYFADNYPYQKLDLIAIPEYWPGAMEHPGAVTFADNILLIDPVSASAAQRKRMARIISHELAHMWFGDLVTMDWWDDLWLNESFADWMGDKIAHQVYPEFNLEVTELQQSINVMNSDARPSSQAIRMEITDTDDLLQNVGVQYNKGKAVLAMFEQSMGADVFRTGVLGYLKAHRWGNAVAGDLWKALAEASGSDVSAAMTTFIEQPGLPLVTAEILPGNRVRLSQERFVNFGTTGMENQHWQIPVTLRFPDGEGTRTQSVLLREKTQIVELEADSEIAWVMPNAQQRGYYRWQVESEMLTAIARQASGTLTERERVGFIGNLSALLDAGTLGGDDYLGALGEFSNDEKPMVISSLMGALGKVQLAFVPEDLEEPFAAYVRKTLGPALERFGPEPRSGEEEAISLFRPQLIRWLGDQGRNSGILDRAEKMASSYMKDPGSIDPSLAQVSLQLAALRGDRKLFDEYRNRFEASQVPTDRRRFLTALASFRDPELVDAALDYAIEGGLRPNEMMGIPRNLDGSEKIRDRVFEWMMDNYQVIGSRIPPVFLSFMPFQAGGCSAERLERAKVFFTEPEHSVSGTEAQLAKVSDQVTDCVSLRQREGAAVAAYLNQLVGSR